jgi:hypothetical protein
VRFSWQSKLVEIEGFADRMVGPPVMGGRLGLLAAGPFRMGMSLAADMAAPKPYALDLGPIDWRVPDTPGMISGMFEPDMGFQVVDSPDPDDGIEPPALPKTDSTRVLPAFGVDLELRAIDRKDARARVYADVNTVDTAWGTHFGVHGGFGVKGAVQIEGHAEIMVFGERYMWAPFDTGYLIDRWQPLLARLDTLRSGSGARMGMTIKDRGLVIGIDFADGTGNRRTDFTGFLRLVYADYGVEGYWRHRSGRSRVATLEHTNAMAAVAGHMKVSDQMWVTMSASRTWREDGNRYYRPFSELLVAVEMSVAQ